MFLYAAPITVSQLDAKVNRSYQSLLHSMWDSPTELTKNEQQQFDQTSLEINFNMVISLQGKCYSEQLTLLLDCFTRLNQSPVIHIF